MSDETSDLGDVCDWCGGEIQQPPTGRRRAYCSRTHREYAYRARREQRLMLRAYSKGKADAESWAVSSTGVSVPSVVERVPSVDETASPAPMPDPGGGWVRSVEEMDAQLRELEERRRRPDGQPMTEPR